ncbi:hypothetical protein VTN00DRAFT_9097 [Thermoascus crustaceus]|uniref:uncharacterized protein n=1 Tax=Thermoascus crustaceus TaxID=5088 RepID=UPI003742ACB6
MSWRRGYFKYREAHHSKLAQGLDFDSGKTEIVAQSTVASSLPLNVKIAGKSRPALDAVDDDERSNTGVSQTSYATSVADPGRLQSPPSPKESENGPFQCPCCYMMISVSNRAAWKKHVFKNLRPYVCLWEDCLVSDQQFSRRHQWLEHVMQKHWRTWHCAFGCQERFQSVAGFKQHMMRHHHDVGAAAQLDTLASLSERPMALGATVQCPLCLDTIPSLKEFQRHVGRHQEELALFALPKTIVDDDTESKLQEDPAESAEPITSGLGERQSDSDLSFPSMKSATQSLSDAEKGTQDAKISDDITVTDQEHLLNERNSLQSKVKELQEQEKNLREAMKEEQRIMREQKEKEEKDKEFRKGLLKEFDYTEEQLDDILHSRDRERKRETESIEQTNRATYIRVHQKHLLPEILIAYHLPWDGMSNYIVIKQWTSEDFQEELIKHTRRLLGGERIREGDVVIEMGNMEHAANRSSRSLDTLRGNQDDINSQVYEGKAYSTKADALISNESLRIALFIDGLDEFDGDEQDLVDLIIAAARLPNVKICAASRPWLIFEDAFENKPSLQLEHLTEKDIKQYVLDKFSQNKRYLQLSSCEPEYALALVNSVVEKAPGVFLWVHLATVLTGFTTPTLAQMLWIVFTAEKTPSLRVFSFADEEDNSLTFQAKVEPIPKADQFNMIEETRQRLNSRCKGLLEVTTNRTVMFLHHTVKDLIAQPRIASQISKGAGETFDACRRLANGYVRELKVLGRLAFRSSKLEPRDVESLRFALRYVLKSESCTGTVQTDLISSLEEAIHHLHESLLSDLADSKNPQPTKFGKSAEFLWILLFYGHH